MAQNSFRVPLPQNFDEILELATNIQTKHLADDVNSPLRILDMAAFASKLTEGSTFNTQAKDLRRQSEEATETRNLTLGIKDGQLSDTPGSVRYYVTAARDVLQGLFRGQERKLGDWGFEVDSSSSASNKRVDIPTNADKLTELAGNIIAKHTADGVDSPLGVVLDMTDFETKYGLANDLVAQAKQLRRNSETATQNRNLALGIARKQKRNSFGTLLYLIASVRDILKGKYRGNAQMLGDWGFTVDASPTSGGEDKDGEEE